MDTKLQSAIVFPVEAVNATKASSDVALPKARDPEVQAVIDGAKKAGDICQNATEEKRRWWEN